MAAAERFLAMARAALDGRSTPTPEPLPTAAVSLTAPPLTARPNLSPAPVVLASYPTAQEVRAARALSSGAARLWEILHRLACDAGRARRYTEQVAQVVMHCPAVTLAGVLGVTDRHLRRLAGELEAAGLLDCGGHAQQVGGRSLYDGTLWAVALTPTTPPRLRAQDWKYNWRPDFGHDVHGKTGAAAEMSELLNQRAEEGERYDAAKRRAAVPGAENHPPLSSSDICARPTLRAVVEGLGQLWHLHATKRARAVGVLASQIAAALAEPDRRRYWCRVIWEAFRGEQQGAGGLQVLGAQLARLDADMREGAPWRNPGAVLAARLKTA